MSILETIAFIKTLLPDHYTVKTGKKLNSIHCTSSIGIDEADVKAWRKFKIELVKHFNGGFQEIFHNVCYNHTDFTIYYK